MYITILHPLKHRTYSFGVFLCGFSTIQKKLSSAD